MFVYLVKLLHNARFSYNRYTVANKIILRLEQFNGDRGVRESTYGSTSCDSIH